MVGFVVAWVFDIPWLRSIQAGLTSLIFGLIIVAGVILRNPRLDRLFTYGPGEDEDGDPLLGCFFAIPIIIALTTFLAWISIQTARFIGMVP